MLIYTWLFFSHLPWLTGKAPAANAAIAFQGGMTEVHKKGIQESQHWFSYFRIDANLR